MLITRYLHGTIKAITTDDTCTVEIVGILGALNVKRTYAAVPIFYHCSTTSTIRSNGALAGAAGAFRVDDKVIVYAQRIPGSSDYINLKVVGFDNQAKRLCNVYCSDATGSLLGPAISSGFTYTGLREVYTQSGDYLNIGPSVYSDVYTNENGYATVTCTASASTPGGLAPTPPGPPSGTFSNQDDRFDWQVLAPPDIEYGYYKVYFTWAISETVTASSGWDPNQETQGGIISGVAGSIVHVLSPGYFDHTVSDQYIYTGGNPARNHSHTDIPGNAYRTLEKCVLLAGGSPVASAFVQALVQCETIEYGSSASGSASVTFSIVSLIIRKILSTLSKDNTVAHDGPWVT